MKEDVVNSWAARREKKNFVKKIVMSCHASKIHKQVVCMLTTTEKMGKLDN